MGIRKYKKLLPGGWIIALVFLYSSAHAQSRFDSVMVKSLKGSSVSFSSLVKKDSILLVCFWSSLSESSINELNAIQKNYSKWQQLAYFKLLAVSTDQGKDMARVRPIVNMNGWMFDVYIDNEEQLRNLLHVTNVPESLVLKNGESVYRQSGFQPGSEEFLLSKIRTMTIKGK